MWLTDNTVLCEPRQWRESSPPKRGQIPIRLHSIMSRKAAFFTVTSVVTSNVTELVSFSVIVRAENTAGVRKANAEGDDFEVGQNKWRRTLKCNGEEGSCFVTITYRHFLMRWLNNAGNS